MSDNRSQIQKDCTNLADTGVELVLGEIYGLRQWRFEYDLKNPKPPTLVGHHGGVWEPEETNYAECKRANTMLSEILNIPASHVAEANEDVLGLLLDHVREFKTQYPEAERISISTFPTRMFMHNKALQVTEHLLANPSLFPDALPWKIERDGSTFCVDGVISSKTHLEFRITAYSPPPVHTVTDPDCVCGFYAYTSPESLSRNSTGWTYVVFGIIKAYGRVTQGTKGFRAEKADILALTRPMKRSWEKAKTSLLPLDSWVPVNIQEVQEVFNFFVPGPIAVHDDLHHLLQTASHLIKFPEEQ